MFVQSFGSGSSGNALLIKSDAGTVLIDCGLSPRALGRALASNGVHMSDLDAVLLTHEHDDHVRGLAGIRGAGLPVVATEGTATVLGLSDEQCRRVACGDSITIAGLSVTTFGTSHDAAESCGYSISDGRSRVTLLTDLGSVSEACHQHVAAAQLIVVEANHDVPMLRSGPYPQHLKRRVLSARGHLSNEDCGAFLANCLAGAPQPRTIWLAHLSATNNRPALAVRTVERALAGLRHKHTIVALPRRESGPIWQPGSATGIAQLAMFE
jgi:phosphoribosyl 1,2-cyclic phosphodiesterase